MRHAFEIDVLDIRSVVGEAVEKPYAQLSKTMLSFNSNVPV